VAGASLAGGSSRYKFRFHNPLGGADLIKGGSSTNIGLNTVGGIEYGVVYDVYVSWKNSSGDWSAEGPMCTVTTPGLPSTSLTGASCGSVASSLNDYVYCSTVFGASLAGGSSKYKFRFHNPAGGDLVKGSSNTAVRLSHIGAIEYGVAYEVYVSWKDASGVWSAEGAMCTVTTPSLPTTNLVAGNCGYSPGTSTEKIYCETVLGASLAGGSSKYKFRFHNPLGGPDLIKGKSTTYFKLNEVGGAEVNTTYDVYVSWKNAAGVWQPEGSMCQITTPATLSKPLDFLVEANEGKSIDEQGFDLIAFPNPTRDDVQVQWTGNSDVVLTLVDLTGKVLYQEMLSNTNTKTLNLESHSSGMYILLVTAGETSQVLQILKE